MSRLHPKNHESLECWKEAMKLVLSVHELVIGFPSFERYALGSQMRRAVYSVPDNIAEGCARETDRELIRALYVARGSLAELDTQLEIVMMLGYAEDVSSILHQVETVSKTLNGYMKYIRTRKPKPVL